MHKAQKQAHFLGAKKWLIQPNLSPGWQPQAQLGDGFTTNRQLKIENLCVIASEAKQSQNNQ